MAINERLIAFREIADEVLSQETGLNRESQAMQILHQYAAIIGCELIEDKYRKGLSSVEAYKLLDDEGLTLGVVSASNLTFLDEGQLTVFDKAAISAIALYFQNANQPHISTPDNEQQAERWTKLCVKALVALGYDINSITTNSRGKKWIREVAMQDGLELIEKKSNGGCLKTIKWLLIIFFSVNVLLLLLRGIGFL